VRRYAFSTIYWLTWFITDILAQAGESHVFVGSEMPAKEWECVLIYDEETGVRRLSASFEN
jgi:hypothetical protein